MIKKLTKKDIRKIAKKYSVLGTTKLAHELGVSRQRVDAIISSLRSYGVLIPKMMPKKAHDNSFQTVIKQVADELIQEMRKNKK